MKNNVKLIIELVEMSSAFTCGHIKYEVVGDEYVHITTATEEAIARDMFTATELCVVLHIFSMYFAIKEGAITLVVR